MFQVLTCYWTFSIAPGFCWQIKGPSLQLISTMWFWAHMAAVLSRSQFQVSDGKLCFSGKHGNYPKQLLFLQMGMIVFFLIISVVKCIRQFVLTSWKNSSVNHFLLHCLLPNILSPKLKICVLSSKSMSGLKWNPIIYVL